MNHPIKRFKSDDSDHQSKFNNRSKVLEYDLYANQNQTESSNLPFSMQNNFIAQNSNDKRNAWKSCEEQKNSGNLNFIKETKSEHETEKLSAENLFTSEGLQPSYADLNKIFDNSDDNSNDDHVSYDVAKFNYNVLIKNLL